MDWEFFLFGPSTLKNGDLDMFPHFGAASLPGNDPYHSYKTTNGQSVKLDGKKSKFESGIM